jgi:hypothetical protein
MRALTALDAGLVTRVLDLRGLGAAARVGAVRIPS